MSFFDGRDQYVDEILEAGRRELEELQKEPEEREREEELARQRKWQMKESMSGKERFHAVLGVMTAGLIIAGIFILAMFLFLLFCTKIWLV